MDVGKNDKWYLDEQQSIMITTMIIIVLYIYPRRRRGLSFLNDKELTLSQQQG